jgi:hypothetical protein
MPRFETGFLGRTINSLANSDMPPFYHGKYVYRVKGSILCAVGNPLKNLFLFQ